MMPIKETGSGSGNSRQNGGRPSENKNSVQQKMPRRNSRHSPQQIQELESIFQQSSHPDIKKRMEIGMKLGLKPDQVKFWFQNHRKQIKVYQNRNDNAVLQTENENLKNEILQLKEELKNSVCSSGHQNAHQLYPEYEHERLLAITSGVAVPWVQTVETATSALMPSVLITDEAKPMAMHLALSYLHELRKICKPSETHRNRGSDDKQVLNVVEHNENIFSPDILSKPHMRTEASRGTAWVIMNGITLLDSFCNADKWMKMFPSIVSKAKTLQIVEGSSGNLNGSLRLMYAELQMLSPLVPPREVHFIRYCQKDEDGSWGIVDFPLDSLMDYTYASPFPKCMRKPSGCIIQEISRIGCSQVTWLEHVEVEDKPVHPIINQFVSSGMAFGAERWLAALKRHGERLYSLTHQDNSYREVPSPEEKSNLMNLAREDWEPQPAPPLQQEKPAS